MKQMIARTFRSRIANCVVTTAAALLACWGAPTATAAQSAVPDSAGPCELTARADTAKEHAPPAACPRPGEPLTLGSALAATLAYDPTLAAFSWDLRIAEAEIIQAALAPNPTLTTEVENFGRVSGSNAADSTEVTVSLGQRVELGGKRRERTRVAGMDRTVAERAYENARNEALGRTSRLFVRALFRQERLDLSMDLLADIREAVRTTENLVRAGAVAPVELSLARVELAHAEAERSRAERELESARTALVTAWGGGHVDFSRLAGRLTIPEPIPALDDLRATEEDSPRVAERRAVLERERAAVALEQSERFPDVTVRLGGRYFESGDAGAFVAELSVPLPLIDRNQGNVAAARHRLARAEAAHRATEVGVRGEVLRAYQALVGAAERCEQLDRTVIPAAQAALANARSAYESGQLRHRDFVEVRRSLFDLRADRLAAQADYHLAAVEIARITGVVATEVRE
jgi:cobalt-zinc-cadmium efflux system outer membrane protein